MIENALASNSMRRYSPYPFLAIHDYILKDRYLLT